MAQALGIELNQRECSHPEGCRGTCPKCADEEKRLNDALKKRGAAGALAVAVSLGLTGCSGEELMRLASAFESFAQGHRASQPAVTETEPETEVMILDGEVGSIFDESETDPAKCEETEDYPQQFELMGMVPYEEGAEYGKESLE